MKRVLLALALGGCQLAFPLRDRESEEVPPIDTWRAVAAGDGHTCALDEAGRLFCWGRNLDGELGRMGAGELGAIREVGGNVTEWRSVATSRRHTCAIDAEGGLWCWGANAHGQLGNGSSVASSDPLQVPLAGALAVSTGELHTCAIDGAGALWCWGRNIAGELGNGTAGPSQMEPVQVATDRSWEAVAAGSFDRGIREGTSCAIAADDRSLWCWGKHLGTTGNTPIPTQLDGARWSKVVIGPTHACGLLETGALRCWGANAFGQLGNGISSSSSPVGVLIDNEERTDWTDVAVGRNYSCGISGERWMCWGASSTGQLGLDGTAINPTPVEIDPSRTWRSLGAGLGHHCAVAVDQTLWCLGGRGTSQLGDGSGSATVPQPLQGRWSSVDAGADGFCATTNTQDAFCTGSSNRVALGFGTTDSRQVLTQIGQSGAWSAIQVGMFHGCGIRNGEVLCWGQGYAAQTLGQISGQQLSPSSVLPTVNAVLVSANGEHSCSIDSTTLLKCWGSDEFGQQGDGTVATPLASGVSIVTGSWAAVEVGELHTCAIDSVASKVSCWGLATDGRLGRAATGNQPVQAQITSALAFRSLSVGNGSTCALSEDGQLGCWGTNYSGELGVGDRESRTTPTMVGPNAIWVAVSIGASHGCGIESNGDLYCWGNNDRGQLGLGTLVDTLTPTKVEVATTWTAVSVGDQFTCAIDIDEGLWCWGDNSLGQLGTGRAWSLAPVQVVAGE